MGFSFQLYSARSCKDFPQLLARLKELGYSAVEGYGKIYGDGGELAARLAQAGLSMPSGHFSLHDLQDIPASISLAQTLGMNTLICPWLEPVARPLNARGWCALARELERLARHYSSHGLTFAWHNHDFELARSGGKTLPMEILLHEAPSLGWQFDVAWAVRAGQDPLDWIERFGGRIVSVHLKDIAPPGQCVDEGGWADLGEGIVNWPEILAALHRHARCTSFVLEHDNPSDVLRFASRSIAAARLLTGAGTGMGSRMGAGEEGP